MFSFLFFFFLVSLWYTRQVLAGLLVITDKALNKDTVFAYFCVSSFPSVQFSFSLIWAQYSFTYKIKLRGNKLYPMIVSILKGRAWGVCFHFFFITFFQVRPLLTDLETWPRTLETPVAPEQMKENAMWIFQLRF